MNLIRIGVVASLCMVMAGEVVTAAEAAVPKPPDFTAGGVRDKTHDWLLGPTGLRGWMFCLAGRTTDARQILVTAVEKGSPADGILDIGAVILGVGGRPFDDDARIQFGNAITAAETKQGGGVLRLIRWRAGQRTNVEVKLSVMGAYSDTAPYDCPKSKAIFEQGCQRIAKRGLESGGYSGIPDNVNALALLASGKEEYRPLLAAYAKKVATSMRKGMGCWQQAYGNLFLAEYVLATGDEAMRAELKRTTMDAVDAQSTYGMWGHGPRKPGGNCSGYGGMNQVGLPMTLSLVLTRQAGVTDPALDKAIAKSSALLRWYVNKGAIPYGDHQPGAGHEDNGKCSLAAVLFDLLGDREATSFYARMATAAYDEREQGHCGNWFNMMWALPSVSRCGPLATGAYLKEQSWYYDLARNWQGGFEYQQIDAGEENNNYVGWDLTGTYLLSYGLPLKSLYVMGKKPCSVPPLNRKEVGDVIAAGRDAYAQQGNEQEALVEKLLADDALMDQMLEAGGAKAGKYGQAMKIYTDILKASPRAREGVLQRLALGTSLEHAVPIAHGSWSEEYSRLKPASTNAPTVVDPVQRYLHYEKAYSDGELDPAFKDMTAWECRYITDSDMPDHMLAWGREMLRNYRPDHILTTDHGWRYSRVVKTDVPYLSSFNYKDSDSLEFVQNVIKNGGICGRRAVFGRFIIQSFGLPSWGVFQDAHAATGRWTPSGWRVNLGAKWKYSWFDGRSGLDFELETQARKYPRDYRKVLRAQWVSDALGEPKYDSLKAGSGGLWNVMAIFEEKRIVAEAKLVQLEAVGQDIGEANESKVKSAIETVTVTDEDRKVVVAPDGVITIPAVACSKPTASTEKIVFMKSFLGGLQLHYNRLAKPEAFEYVVDAPEAGKYALRARVVTVGGRGREGAATTRPSRAGGDGKF